MLRCWWMRGFGHKYQYGLIILTWLRGTLLVYVWSCGDDMMRVLIQAASFCVMAAGLISASESLLCRPGERKVPGINPLNKPNSLDETPEHALLWFSRGRKRSSMSCLKDSELKRFNFFMFIYSKIEIFVSILGNLWTASIDYLSKLLWDNIGVITQRDSSRDSVDQ